jgi:hypothetical protein
VVDDATALDAVFESAPPARDQALDDALKRALRGGAVRIDTHLTCSERDIVVGSTRTRVHCYFLPLDGNGRVRVKPLAEFLRDQIIDYAIPRRTIEEAFKKFEESGSAAPLSKLHERAKSLFTTLANTGEGGELLVFAMAEAVFGITQIICKMSLKTSTSMHYHGADGVYAEARPDGGLNLYWAESKIYGDPADAIRNCLESLAPFLRQEEGEDAVRQQDILLVNEFANFTDKRLIAALKKFLDRDDPASLKVTHCGFALCAFDCSAYPGADAASTMDAIAEAIKDEQSKWIDAAQRRVIHEGLQNFDMHFICVPMPSAEDFRKYFLELLGVTSEP